MNLVWEEGGHHSSTRKKMRGEANLFAPLRSHLLQRPSVALLCVGDARREADCGQMRYPVGAREPEARELRTS